MAALFQAQEPKDGGFNRLADGEEAVVLKQGSFAQAESSGDVIAFSFSEDDAVEGCVEGVVLDAQLYERMKGQGLLRDEWGRGKRRLNVCYEKSKRPA